MKRILLVLALATVMATVLVVSATSVFAAVPATDDIQQFRSMKECKQLSTVPKQCHPDR